jgi:hypothetical protein
MDFVKYQHIERLNTDEVEGITGGFCHVFPKIDGTNGSIWLRTGELQFGSRNRDLEGGDDNQGFRDAVSKIPGVRSYLEAHPNHRLFGEWLVPHSLKTYREDAWRKFYVFDVCVETAGENDEGPAEEGEGIEYLPYSMYQPWLAEHGLDFIPLLAEVRNGTDDQFYNLLEQNTFLVKDGCGVGEGIVIKNYSYRNKYGRVKWAKVVRSEFKDMNHLTFGAPIIQGERMVEQDIVEKFCTDALIEKEFAKIVAEVGKWESKLIPRLLGTVFYCLITESAWEMVKEFKNPIVNFKTLNRLTIDKIKERQSRLFA